MIENEFIEKEHASVESNTNGKKIRKSKNQSKSSRPSAFTQILNGDFLSKEFVINNLGFIFFIILLLLLVVAKGYYGKQLLQKINQTQTSLDELTSDYVESKAKLEEETRRYKLVEKLGPKGLKETQNKTKVIRIKKEE
jgi:hypothetical protein